MSFGAVAGDYDRVRPGPPAEAIDWLLPARRAVAVDVGAGTGLLTRALAGKVEHVIAVEPDQRMRSVLQAKSAGVSVLAGRGEAIPLPDSSADAVLVSSAWQWLRPQEAVPEIARVLRDGGRLGLIWTSRERDIGWLHPDEWFREVSAEQADDLTGSPERSVAPGGNGRQVLLPDQAPFRNIETREFKFSRYMPVPDVVAMLATYSGIITASPEARAAGQARAAAALAAQFPGAAELEVPMRSWCWRADRLPRQG